MKLKIDTKDKAGICGVCRNGQVLYQGSSVTVICHYSNGSLITRRVDECSSHVDRTSPSIHNMEAIAWVLKTSENRQVGFDVSKVVREVEFSPPEKKEKEFPWDE